MKEYVMCPQADSGRSITVSRGLGPLNYGTSCKYGVQTLLAFVMVGSKYFRFTWFPSKPEMPTSDSPTLWARMFHSTGKERRRKVEKKRGTYLFLHCHWIGSIVSGMGQKIIICCFLEPFSPQLLPPSIPMVWIQKKRAKIGGIPTFCWDQQGHLWCPQFTWW